MILEDLDNTLTQLNEYQDLVNKRLTSKKNKYIINT